ncbi:hydroxymethylglutaryl-CoA synthase [Acholeplasma equirhinis]|uniref:hydroxymethylglutaryl-CoA synthase n=1 Tax=Acholeplasma equirhinis TaxID=555393 RepID=UPI00197AE273|nr:hydroxymethylglutaryl-CoA synthase [Acholeplasma equirhinis]MBN3490826.1 hydroxymethylglutaryl-CoA synthase [Acholeplasma equirhinis]
MKIGISKISFFVPKYYLSLATLAEARGADPLKYTNGLLQNKMAVAPINQDIVSMAANAASNILTEEDKKDIDLVLFATESGIDHSKAAATNLAQLLNLKSEIRAIELKQACYSATIALYFAKGHILQNPNSKVLVVGSDIARYGLETDGEPTQGAGAVAMLITKKPKILVLENTYAFNTSNIYDFWRPVTMDYALVDGHFSNEQYKAFFKTTFEKYQEKSGLTLADFKAMTFHIPYTKIGLRSLQTIAKLSTHPELFKNFEYSTTYNKEVGNIYTGSLYLSLISLLENGKLKSKDRIGMFSYGSGAVAEFFSGILVPGYKKHLVKDIHKQILKNRQKLTFNAYAKMLTDIPKNDVLVEYEDDQTFQLVEISDYERKYMKKA